METTHRVRVADARDLDLPDESVELVVTSPPYPMIEMWDGMFAELDPAVGAAVEDGDGEAAFERMHEALDPVWTELARVLVPGGIACVNVGDAVRSLGGEFCQYPNHVEVTRRLADRGLRPLPDVLWRKPVNSANKFMGSGTLPTNAYVTLEHEYVLVFRKGGTRTFPAGDRRRYESAFFWEERNEWFSDVWTDVHGAGQTLDAETRERSGAFPLELPYRLVCMYSVYGDTVLDPFWGTGTTSLAAMVAGRNSVGYEREPGLAAAFEDRAERAPTLSRDLLDRRLADHREFVSKNPGKCNYEATHYEFPVVTKQEQDLRLYAVADVRETEEGYAATHEPYPE